MFKVLLLATLLGGGDGTPPVERRDAPEGVQNVAVARDGAPSSTTPLVTDQPAPGGAGGKATSGPVPTSSSTTNQGPTSEFGTPPQLTIFEVTIPGGPNGTQTGFKEKFIVSAPVQSQPRPLLVVFHKFSVSQKDALVHTSFFEEAWKRGWHIIAPLSAAGVNMSSVIGQTNTEVALEWMTSNFNVDPERIYGVGFSMGGGTLMSYAARHVDPARPMFAAVVEHTGGIAINDTFANEPSIAFIFDFWFGNGSPGSASPWKMTASSLFDFNPVTLVVDSSSDMARNLEYLPTKIFRVADDPVLYLRVQSDVLATHLVSQGTQVKYQIVPGPTHGWDALSETQTVNWLAQKRRTLPLSGRILADRDEKFFHFTVTQAVPLVFSKLNWNLDLPGNIVSFTATENLTQVEIATAEAGLSSAVALQVDMDTADALAVEYVVSDWPTAPSAVKRDGLVTTAFVYDGLASTVTLQETVAGSHTWVIEP